MAQRFVGSNNLPLLYPSGQFGTRLQGGEDAASPRYIFTSLNNFTRLIFPEDDDRLLPSQFEDGVEIEPQTYVPIIPMTLINGVQGIGTGWSTSIPCYNPFEIIRILKSLILGRNGEKGREEDTGKGQELTPWYAGFKGKIEKHDEEGKFVCSGCFVLERKKPLRIRVTELPIGMWTESFQEHLNRLSERSEEKTAVISSYSPNNSEAAVDTSITFTDEARMELMENGVLNEGALMKLLKLTNLISLNNMILFAPDGKIKQYFHPVDIIADYFPQRMRLYELRKKMQEARLSAQSMRLTNQYRFLSAVANGEFKFERKTKQELVKELQDKGFRSQEDMDKVFVEQEEGEALRREGAPLEYAQVALLPLTLMMQDGEWGEGEQLRVLSHSLSSVIFTAVNRFLYLLQMPLWSATRERREKLKKQVTARREERLS